MKRQEWKVERDLEEWKGARHRERWDGPPGPVVAEEDVARGARAPHRD